MTPEARLQQLVDNGSIQSFELKKQIPSMEGDTKSRLVDELVIILPNWEKLTFSTFCSGSLENTSLNIE